MRRIKLILPLAACILLTIGIPTLAASRIVDSTSDANLTACTAAPNDCTLRGAINASASGDFINFASFFFEPNPPVVITLGSELAIIDKDLTVMGPGALQLTVSGNGITRLFSLSATSTFSLIPPTGNTHVVSLSEMTLTGGNGMGALEPGKGGAIYATSVSVQMNRLYLTDNHTSGSGGAVFLLGGTNTLFNSTIELNTAFSCAGFDNQLATLYVANSTISNNSSSVHSGGFCNAGTAFLRNVTITLNHADNNAGGFSNTDDLAMLNLGNTIVAGNTAPSAPDILYANVFGAIMQSAGGNLIGNNTGAAGVFPPGNPNGNNDRVNVPAGLLGLNQNGGQTKTHALSGGSLARDHGINSNAVDPSTGAPLGSDQRGLGFPRTISGTVDIGAFEASPTAAGGSIRGQVTTSDGTTLGGVVIRLSGAHSRTTITDAAGNYHFDGLDTNAFYNINPVRVNYSFNPTSRSFSLLASQTEALFTASTDASERSNPLDTTEFFVRQQYLDFLNREPDQSGFEYWSREINQCGEDSVCLRRRRVDVAAAFFIEQEFQLTGSYLHNLYQGVLGRRPRFAEYRSDRPQLLGGPNLEATKAAFAESFVQRAEVSRKYETQTTAQTFVDAIILTARNSGADLESRRAELIAAYDSGDSMFRSRARVVQFLADDPMFKQVNFNRAFVLSEYFSYLQRDPDVNGYDFWVEVLTNRTPGNYRGMVCAFVTSTEYQRRFASVVTHSNSECGP
jgi:hypothetical protein